MRPVGRVAALGSLARMKDSKNMSPVGWYVGSYVLRFVELAERGNNDPKRKFLTWENTVIVTARSLDHAYDKIVAIAKRGTEPYKGGPSPGIDVQWLFEGVTELLPIYEKLEDGAEIMWAEHSLRSLKKIRSWARKKKQFHQ